MNPELLEALDYFLPRWVELLAHVNENRRWYGESPVYKRVFAATEAYTLPDADDIVKFASYVVAAMPYFTPHTPERLRVLAIAQDLVQYDRRPAWIF